MPKAVWKGAVIAESADTVIVEGNHYFPADSVHREYLVESDTHTVCPWKGTASYFTIEVDGQRNEDAAWFYPAPSKAAQKVSDRIAFWRGVRIVDDDEETSSAGGILSRLVRRR